MEVRYKKGFTLMEALVALAIVSVIILALSPMISKKINKKATKPTYNNVQLLREIADLETEYNYLLQSVCNIERQLEKSGCLTGGLSDECKR